MSLQFTSSFSMIGTVLHQSLVATASCSIEELLQGTWHLNSIIIFEASVQLTQHLLEAILCIRNLVDQVLDLSPGNT